MVQLCLASSVVGKLGRPTTNYEDLTTRTTIVTRQDHKGSHKKQNGYITKGNRHGIDVCLAVPRLHVLLGLAPPSHAQLLSFPSNITMQRGDDETEHQITPPSLFKPFLGSLTIINHTLTIIINHILTIIYHNHQCFHPSFAFFRKIPPSFQGFHIIRPSPSLKFPSPPVGC